MFPIQRIPGTVPTRSWGSAYRGLVWALGMSDDFTLDFAGQAQRAFAALDNGLAQVGTDKRRLISVQVFLEDAAAQKKEFDDMWTDWIGMNTEHWPMRSCVQVTFTGGNRIELLAVAVRDEPVMETDDSA